MPKVLVGTTFWEPWDHSNFIFGWSPMIPEQTAANMVRGKTTGVNRRKVNRAVSTNLTSPNTTKRTCTKRKELSTRKTSRYEDTGLFSTAIVTNPPRKQRGSTTPEPLWEPVPPDTNFVRHHAPRPLCVHPFVLSWTKGEKIGLNNFEGFSIEIRFPTTFGFCIALE